MQVVLSLVEKLLKLEEGSLDFRKALDLAVWSSRMPADFTAEGFPAVKRLLDSSRGEVGLKNCWIQLAGAD